MLEAARARRVAKVRETMLAPSPLGFTSTPTADGVLNWVDARSRDRILEGAVYTDGSTFDPKVQQLARSGCGFAQLDEGGALTKWAW